MQTVYRECTAAERGCVDCKRQLAGAINDYLEPLRERRREFEKRPEFVKEILDEGGKRARSIAQQTVDEVYGRMGLGTYIRSAR